MGLSVGQHSLCPLHVSLQQLGASNLTGLLGRGHRAHFRLGTGGGAAGHTGEILSRLRGQGPSQGHLDGVSIIKSPWRPPVRDPPAGTPRPGKASSLLWEAQEPTLLTPQQQRPLSACITSEPEGEAGSLAAGDAGRLPRSETSKARSLRATSRGFFFFSAS